MQVSEGLTESDITVCVRDIEGRDQFIHVLPSMVNCVGNALSAGGRDQR